MRLGQLARKLEVKPADIVKYLEKENKTEMNSHPNSKVEDGLIPAIEKHFGKAEEPVKTEAKEDVAPKAEAKTEEVKPDPAAETKAEDTVDMEKVEHIETVKPEKLTGPKVIDKIDLPPPPPPEMIEVDGVMMEKAEYRKKKAEERKAKQAEREQARVRKIARQEAIEEDPAAARVILSDKEKAKKDQELERKLKRKKEVEAKKRKEHYFEKHAMAAPSKKKKAKAKNIDPLFSDDQDKPKSSVNAQEEGSLLKRIWKWFNT